MDDEVVEGRLDLIDDRLDHQDARITLLEGAREVKKAHSLELIVIVLVSIETIFTALMYFHHG